MNLSFLKKFSANYLLLVFSIILMNALSSCNEQPTDIGVPLLFDTIAVYPFSSNHNTIFTGQNSFFAKARLFNIGVNFVGRTNDIITSSLLRFQESNIPDSLLYLDTTRAVTSVTLRLKPTRYAFGDTISNYLSFKVYRFKTGVYWSDVSTWDSVFKSDVTSDMLEPTPIAQWSGSIALADSIPELDIPITDYSFVYDWLQQQKDSIPIWGLALVPDQSSNVIRQFLGDALSVTDANAPNLRILYNNRNTGAADSLFMFSAINKTVIKAPQIDSTEFAIQGAVSYRSQLNFDLSSLPLNASIYKAQLELTYDPLKSKLGNYKIDSVLDAGLFISDSNALESPSNKYYASLSGYKYIFPNVTSAVEWWLRRSKKGSLVFITAGWNEYYRLDKISFCGLNDADTTKRPKLLIIYSRRPY